MFFLIIYAAIAVNIYCNILFTIYALNSLKAVSNAKERSKISEKINSLSNLKFYCLIWPYVVIKIKNL